MPKLDEGLVDMLDNGILDREMTTVSLSWLYICWMCIKNLLAVSYFCVALPRAAKCGIANMQIRNAQRVFCYRN